jgi:aminodeoxyfutalosine deaminase
MLTREFFEAMPKVELHVHLEGATQPETLLKLAKRNGIELPATDIEGVKKWFQFENFDQFVQVYIACIECFRSGEDIELLAEEFAREQARQNILYTEATYTAETIFRRCGVPADEQIEALRSGFAKVPETRVELIIDIVRDMDTPNGEWTAELCKKWFGKGVCAIGLSGFEGRTSVSRHSAAIREAKKAGLKCSTHAGETQGADSIREVLEHADPDRIGHGVRCVEDPHLVAQLRDSQIHLEVNPSSNVCLGVFPSLEEHSLPRMMDEGLNLSINSDDPPFFNTTLSDEYLRCAETFEFSTDVVYSLAVNAAKNAFLPEPEMRELIARVSAGFSALTSGLD